MSSKPPASFGQLLDVVRDMCKKAQIWDTTGDMQHDLPKKWEKHGDMIILPHDCFTLKQWRLLGPDLWKGVAAALQATRVGRKRQIEEDPYRTPLIELKFGTDGWVQHEHKGITYEYDVTRCMFRIGDMSEKQRMGEINCSQEVVVDLFAGLGYYTLAYLVHANAKHVYACDWDEDAVEALKRNVLLNNVADRCTVVFGDVRKTVPCLTADRVNAPLLPTSKPHWLTVCKCLKRTGGYLHLHMTCENKETRGVEGGRRNSLTMMDSAQSVNIDRKNQSSLRKVSKGTVPRNVFKKQPSKDLTNIDEDDMKPPTIINSNPSTPIENKSFDMEDTSETASKEGVRVMKSKMERSDSGFSANCDDVDTSTTHTNSDGLEDSADEVKEERKLSRRERGLQSRAASIVEEMLARRQAPHVIAAHLLESGQWEKYPQLWKDICVDAATSCTKYMDNLHEVEGHGYVCSVLRCGKVKQYTPHLEHIVIDLHVRSVPLEQIDYDGDKKSVAS